MSDITKLDSFYILCGGNSTTYTKIEVQSDSYAILARIRCNYNNYSISNIITIKLANNGFYYRVSNGSLMVSIKILGYIKKSPKYILDKHLITIQNQKCYISDTVSKLELLNAKLKGSLTLVPEGGELSINE